MEETTRIPPSTPLAVWLDKLAEAQGAPGGGAACGVMLGLSAALLRMVAKYTADDERAEACAFRLVDMRREALAAAADDGVRSTDLGDALGLAADDPARDDRVRTAAIEAARSSAMLGEIGVALIDELRLLADIGNPNLNADLGVAGEALGAGIAGASINLRANLALARAHGVDEGLDSLDAAVRRLSDARSTAAQIARDTASAFDKS